MKPSHYQTPRTLSECSFEVGHSGFEDQIYSGKTSYAPFWVFAAALAAFLLMVWQ